MSDDTEAAMGKAPISLLFVCTANVSRSPYAHHRALQLFGGHLDVESAGIPGTEGWRMDPSMEARLPYVDRAVLEHRSRRLTSEVLARSDLVLTMEFEHQMRILDQWPEAVGRVYGIRQFVAALSAVQADEPAETRLARAPHRVAPNSIGLNIADPYHRGRRAARRCADELDDLVLRLGLGLGYQPVSEG